MDRKKRKEMTMEDVTAGYEAFIKGKKTKKSSKKLFNKTLKKAVKPRGSK